MLIAFNSIILSHFQISAMYKILKDFFPTHGPSPPSQREGLVSHLDTFSGRIWKYKYTDIYRSFTKIYRHADLSTTLLRA